MIDELSHGKRVSMSCLPVQAWYDARIISIDSKPHEPCCVCKFYVSFYGAHMEDVLDIEHRPLYTGRKKKLRIENITILQAPYQLQEQPPETEKRVEIWRGDSRSVYMPILADKTLKLQIAKLISLSAKLGHVAEISLRLDKKGELLTNMHEAYTFSLKDQENHGCLSMMKFQASGDNDCFIIEEHEKMVIYSNRDVGYIILHIDKGDVMSLCLQPDNQENLEQVTGNTDYSDGWQNSLIPEDWSKRSRDSQNRTIFLRCSKRLIKQQKQVEQRKLYSAVSPVQENKRSGKQYARKKGLTGKSKGFGLQGKNVKLISKDLSNTAMKSQEDIDVFRQSKQKSVLVGKHTSKRKRDPNADVTILRRSKRLLEQRKRVEDKFMSYVTCQAKGKKSLGKHHALEEAGQHRKKKQRIDRQLPKRKIEPQNSLTIMRRPWQSQKQGEKILKEKLAGVKGNLVESKVQRKALALIDEHSSKRSRKFETEIVVSERATRSQSQGISVREENASFLALLTGSNESTKKPDTTKPRLREKLHKTELQSQTLGSIHIHPSKETEESHNSILAIRHCKNLQEKGKQSERGNVSGAAPQVEASKPTYKCDTGNQVFTMKLDVCELSSQECKSKANEKTNVESKMDNVAAKTSHIGVSSRKIGNTNSGNSLKADKGGLERQKCKMKNSEDINTENESEKEAATISQVDQSRNEIDKSNSAEDVDFEIEKPSACISHTDVFTEKIGNAKEGFSLDEDRLPCIKCKRNGSKEAVTKDEMVKVTAGMLHINTCIKKTGTENPEISFTLGEIALPSEKSKTKDSDKSTTDKEMKKVTARISHIDVSTDRIGNTSSGICLNMKEVGLPRENYKTKGCEAIAKNEMEKVTTKTSNIDMPTNKIGITNLGISVKLTEIGFPVKKCKIKAIEEVNTENEMEKLSVRMTHLNVTAKEISNLNSGISLKLEEDGLPREMCETKGNEESDIGNTMTKETPGVSHTGVPTLKIGNTDQEIYLKSDHSDSEKDCLLHLKDGGKHAGEFQKKPRWPYVGKDTTWCSKHPPRRTEESHGDVNALRSSKCSQEQDKQTKRGNVTYVGDQEEGNKPTHKHNAEKEMLTVKMEEYVLPSQKCNVKGGKETSAENEVENVTARPSQINLSIKKIGNANSVISLMSDNSDRESECPQILKDREKHTREVQDRPSLSSVRKDETDINISLERSVPYEPLLTAEVKATEKESQEEMVKAEFQHLTASIENEIRKPPPPILDRWSMEDKKSRACEDLIFDLIINEDDLNLKSKSGEESSDLKDLWTKMEQASQGDRLTSTSIYTVNGEVPCNSTEAEDAVYNHLCMGEHEYMLDEEIGLICKECKFVKMEISNVLPPFRVWKSERSRSREDYVYMDKDFGNIVTPILDYLKGSLPSQSHDLSRNHDSVWKIIPALEKQMNDHQKWGFEFLWRNIAGSLNPKNMKTSCNDVGGCIIAHAPGTGKTFLIISFLQSYLALFPRCKPLIVAPKSMLHTWKREFKKWNVNIPIYILNSLRDHRKKESPLTKDYKVPFRQLYNIYCMTMLHEWHKKESVLLISYSQFFHFTNEENDKLSEETRKIGRLLKGSPGILILDEGHIPRSHDSKIWNLLMRVNTNLRILLSGTLFQNNFEEYFNTLCLARPTFVDRILQRHPTLSHVSTFGKHSSREMEDMLKEKVARRYFLDEIAKRIRTGTRKERSECYHKLKSMTEDFIDVYKGEVLNELPGLTTYTVMLRPTLLQEILLEKIDESISKENGSSLELEIMISMASIHPSIVKDLSFIGKYSGIDICKLETFRKNPEEGIKLKFVIDLVGLCRDKGEKVLIFCQHLPPLYLLEEIFESHLNWYKDKEILLLTGNLSLDERQDIIDLKQIMMTEMK